MSFHLTTMGMSSYSFHHHTNPQFSLGHVLRKTVQLNKKCSTPRYQDSTVSHYMSHSSHTPSPPWCVIEVSPYIISRLSHPHHKDDVLWDLLISVDIWEKINEELKNPWFRQERFVLSEWTTLSFFKWLSKLIQCVVVTGCIRGGKKKPTVCMCMCVCVCVRVRIWWH